MEDNVLIISLNGHIDSGNAADVEKEINQLREENTFENIYLDAENLEYISSAGLRIILRLRKNYSELKIVNVHPDVYEILDMTEVQGTIESFKQIFKQRQPLSGTGFFLAFT